MSNGSTFTFSAEPRALAATMKAPPTRSVLATTTTTSNEATLKRPKYREEAKEATLSLMSDPRVFRGTNYSHRPASFLRPATVTQPGAPPTQSAHLPTSLRDQSTLPAAYSATLSSPALSKAKARSPAFVRPETPPPVANRLHLSTQTDPVYHDLRSSAHPPPASIVTQTDAEMDVDTPALFTVRSSGVDVGTEMEAGA